MEAQIYIKVPFKLYWIDPKRTKRRLFTWYWSDHKVQCCVVLATAPFTDSFAEERSWLNAAVHTALPTQEARQRVTSGTQGFLRNAGGASVDNFITCSTVLTLFSSRVSSVPSFLCYAFSSQCSLQFVAENYKLLHSVSFTVITSVSYFKQAHTFPGSNYRIDYRLH